MKILRCAALLAGGAILAAAPVHATTYNYVTIDAPDPNSVGITASSINVSGQVAGFYVDATPFGPVYHAFTVKADGTGCLTIDRPGYLATGGAGINGAGEIVGVSVDPSLNATGFLRSPGGIFSTIDPNSGGLVSAYSEAVGINNVGDVVGFFSPTVPVGDPQLTSHGFLAHGGVFTQLDVPAAFGTGTQAYSINDFGEITGSYLDALGLPQGFVYKPGIGYVIPSVPGFGAFTLGAVNNAGVFPAVREFLDPTNPTNLGFVSFIDDHEVYTPFAVPGAKYTDVYAINDAGQISGLYIDNANAIHAFVATIPEPATWVLMLVGIGIAGGMIGKTRNRVD